MIGIGGTGWGGAGRWFAAAALALSLAAAPGGAAHAAAEGPPPPSVKPDPPSDARPAVEAPAPSLPTVGLPAVKPPDAEPEDTRTTVLKDRTARCSDAVDGNREVAFRLARRNLFGIGVRRNARTGVAWLRVAAAMGHGEARRLLRFVPSAMGRTPPPCDGGPSGTGGRGGATPPAAVRAMVARLAPEYGLDPDLVLTVMRIESGFRTEVISPKAAAGLMQLIPATAERFGVSDVFDAEDNARGGMAYLRWLLSYFRGDVILATAGYNAGEGAVDRYKGVPPYMETRNYVRMVREYYGRERHPFDPALSAPSPVVALNMAAKPAE